MASDTTTRTYKVKGTTGDVTDCELCGRTNLKKTVVLAVLDVDGNEADVVHFGSDCAARAIGWTQTQVRNEAASADTRAAQHAEVQAERRHRYSLALAQLHQDGEPFELHTARRTFHQLGGYDALGKFPAWLAAVAETGEL